jgi:hypothetical protein
MEAGTATQDEQDLYNRVTQQYREQRQPGANAPAAAPAAPSAAQPVRKVVNGVTYEQDPVTGTVRKVQ